jgi:hypothetical protein
MGAANRAEAATSTDAHQFLVAERLYLFSPAPVPVNGLFSITDGCMTVYVGASSGLVTVAVEPRTTAPSTTDLDDWDEVGEGDLHATQGEVIVRALMDSPPDLPVLTTQGPGNYRARIHAKGRDLHPDLVAFEPVEKYLIQIWPAAQPEGDRVIKQSDAYGRSLRQTVTATVPSTPRTTPPRPVPRP